MGIVPVSVLNQPQISVDNKNGLVSRAENPLLEKVMEERRRHFRRPEDQDPSLLERIALQSRVLIVEGISGSGKDTFQKHLKSKLRGRVVHDYSEGELLWSWKHQQIKDIFKMQIRLMRNFLAYVAVTIERDDKAVFLLNRFHLSTNVTMYTTAINEHATLTRDYNMVIKALRALPTHVFLLQLREVEMEARSNHPERGIAWRRYQQHILEREGFGNFVKRNVTLQKAMVETAMRQNIPFSILRLPSETSLGMSEPRSPDATIITNQGAALNPLAEKLDRRRHRPQEAM